MARISTALSEDDLERELLRKSVGALSAARHPCADCGRTPLTGERVHRYPRGTVVCDLCRQLRKTEPDRTDTVRHSEHGHTVLKVTRVAA